MMLVLKTKGSIVISVFLMVLIFAISECKRGGGGGGRIFRTTILKGRRNSRRSRDLQAQQKIKSQWTNSLPVSNKMLDETLETHYAPNNYNDIEKSLIYVYPHGFIEQKKEYHNSAEDMTLQPINWNYEQNLKNVRYASKNFEKDDDTSDTEKELLNKYSYSSHGYILHGYPKTYGNTQKYIADQIVSKYDQTLSDVNKEDYSNEENRANVLLNNILGINTNKHHNSIESYKEYFDLNKNDEIDMYYDLDKYNEYNTYSYYNNPKNIPEKIILSTKIISCQKDLTSLCVPNTVPLCTSTDEILCTAPKQHTVPCNENPALKCVNTTVTMCTDEDKYSCKGSEEIRIINLPCLTNASIRVQQEDVIDDTTFCVVSLLIPKNKKEPDEPATPLFI